MLPLIRQPLIAGVDMFDKRYFILAFLLCFGVPLFLSAFYKMGQHFGMLGSVGPWIPCTTIINLFALPISLIMAVKTNQDRKSLVIILRIMSLLLGIILVYIHFSIFIVITMLFGIMDYQLM